MLRATNKSIDAGLQSWVGSKALKTRDEILSAHATEVIRITNEHIKAYQNTDEQKGKVYSNETTTVATAIRAAKSFRRYIVEGKRVVCKESILEYLEHSSTN